MPAVGMGGDPANYANPTDNLSVACSPFSGPKGSPFDAQRCVLALTVTNGVMDKEADPTNYSTGALNTGIGYGSNSPIINPTAPPSMLAAGFSDDITPGYSYYKPTGRGVAEDTRILAIGGGRNTLQAGTGPNGNGYPAGHVVSLPSPYAPLMICGFGTGVLEQAGGSRDGTTAGRGFGMKMVTSSVATVAVGAAIETGFINRTGVIMKQGFSANGSYLAESPAIV